MPSNYEVTDVKDEFSAQRFILRITDLDDNGESQGGQTEVQVVAEGIIGSPEGRSVGSPGDLRIRQDIPQLWQKQSGINTRTGWALISGSGTGEITVQDDGVDIGQRATLNFTGDVVVTDDPVNERVDIAIGTAQATAWQTILDVDLTQESSVDIKAGGDGNYVLDSGEIISVENSASTTSYDIVNGTGIVIVAQFNGTIFATTRTAALFKMLFSQFDLVPHIPTKFMVEYQLTNATDQFEGMVLMTEHFAIPGPFPNDINNLYCFDQSDGAGDRELTWGRTNGGTSTSTPNTVLTNADYLVADPRCLMLSSDSAYADWRPSFSGEADLPDLVTSTDWISIGVSAVSAAVNRSFDNTTGALLVACRSIAASAVTLTVTRLRVAAIQ